MKISACLIVKNEEKVIESCLKSLKNYIDEIIVVDTGSTDKTKDIVKKYTSNLFDFEWVDDFSAARNFSLSKATGDFILIIDADEILENGNVLRTFIETQEESFGGWLVNLDSFAINNGVTNKYTNQLLRLIKNYNRFQFEGIIHEQVINSITNSGYKIGNSELLISHSGYNLNEIEMQKKQERNLILLEKHIENNPDDGYNLFNLAKTYFAMKNKIKAKYYFENALTKCEKDGIVYVSCLNYFSVLLFQEKEYNRVIELCNESLKINNNQAFANYILGDTFFELKDYEESLKHYEDLLSAILKPTNYSKIIGDYHLPLSQVYFRIGRSLVNMNKYDLAIENFEKGIKENSNDRNCLIGLIEMLIQTKSFERVDELIEEAKVKFPNDKVFENIENKYNSIKNSPTPKQVNSIQALKAKIKSNSNKQILNNNETLITLSMIVKNEEKMLEGCLESVQGLVDEIIIVDTGSEDNTKLIAKKYNAKIFDFKWIDDFAAARNESLKHSNGKWILYLDADERIDRSILNIDKLRNDLKSADNNLGGIIVTIESDHSNMDGSSEKHRGGYPRLFRNLGFPKIYFKGRVHEQITPSLMENNLGMMKSDIKIIHEGYNIPEELMQKKLKRNYTLLLKHVQEEPLNGYAWYQLGQTLGRMQLLKESQDAIEMSIKCGTLSDSVYASAASTLAQYSGNKKEYEKALYWAEESLSKAPNQIYGLNLKGYALLELGRKKEAKEIFLKAHELWKRNDINVPQSGFDIMIDEKVILNGLKKSQN